LVILVDNSEGKWDRPIRRTSNMFPQQEYLLYMCKTLRRLTFMRKVQAMPLLRWIHKWKERRNLIII